MTISMPPNCLTGESTSPWPIAREFRAAGFRVDAFAPELTQNEATDCAVTGHHALYENLPTQSHFLYPANIDGTLVHLPSALSEFVSEQTVPVNDGLVFN